MKTRSSKTRLNHRVALGFVVCLVAAIYNNGTILSRPSLTHGIETRLEREIASPSFSVGKSEEQPASGTALSISNTFKKNSTLEEVVEETTRLLYKDSLNLSNWLAAPLPKIYIYDTVPKEWSDIETISECINDNYLTVKQRKKSIHLNWTNCLWEPSICDNIENPGSTRNEQKLMNHKANFNNDVAYLKWFRGYSHLTTTPLEADIFLVPYPLKSHCLCQGKMESRCSYGLEEMQTNVLDKLAYYLNFTDRHLFLYGSDWGLVNPGVRGALEESMSISLGPADGCRGRIGRLCGHFVTPYLSSGAAFQPQALEDELWEGTSRGFSLGAVFGTPSFFRLRLEMMKNRTTHFGDSLGGLPMKLIDLGEDRVQIIEREMADIYRNSVFCPILPGDGCPQKRFFDVILSGCIPVVPRFTPSDEQEYPTFFNWMNRCSIRRTYPFAKGSFFGDMAAGVDYESLVVSFDGVCGIACMKPAIEEVMSNATDLKRIRANLKEYAKLFTFGLDQNMYQSVDGFSAMLVALRHYVFNLKGRFS